jgi:acyl-CoA synthetase (NDP forming)
MLLITGYLCGYERYGDRAAEAELETVRRLAALARETPMAVHTMHPQTRAARELRDAGVPVYRDVEAAVTALARIACPRAPAVRRWAGGSRPSGFRVPPLPAPAPPFEDLEYSALRASLARAGIPFIAAREVRTPEEAVTAAGDLGYPVALKALGRLHKSDAGGVALALGDQAALERAVADMEHRLHPPAYSVERMADLDAGIELIIGARWDPRFGALVMVGAGGINAETLHDVAVALAPIDHAQALDLIRRLRVAALLAGARGRPPLDIEAAAAALLVLSEVAAEHPEIADLEINPLLVTPEGAIALDARALAREPLRL